MRQPQISLGLIAHREQAYYCTLLKVASEKINNSRHQESGTLFTKVSRAFLKKYCTLSWHVSSKITQYFSQHQRTSLSGLEHGPALGSVQVMTDPGRVCSLESQDLWTSWRSPDLRYQVEHHIVDLSTRSRLASLVLASIGEVSAKLWQKGFSFLMSIRAFCLSSR